MVLDQFDFNRVSEYFGFHFALSDYPKEKLLKARVVIETGALFYTMEAMKSEPGLVSPAAEAGRSGSRHRATPPISGGSSTTSPFIAGWSMPATSRRWRRSATCSSRSSTSSATAWSRAMPRATARDTSRSSRTFTKESWRRPSSCCAATSVGTSRRIRHENRSFCGNFGGDRDWRSHASRRRLRRRRPSCPRRGSGRPHGSRPHEPFFSFRYAGKSSAELLGQWELKRASRPLDAERTEHTLAVHRPQDRAWRSVALRWCTPTFRSSSGRSIFRTAGSSKTPILQDIQAPGHSHGKARRRRIRAPRRRRRLCAPESYQPYEHDLGPNVTKAFAPVGGRPTNGSFPYYNVALPGGGRDSGPRLAGPMGHQLCPGCRPRAADHGRPAIDASLSQAGRGDPHAAGGLDVLERQRPRAGAKPLAPLDARPQHAASRRQAAGPHRPHVLGQSLRHERRHSGYAARRRGLHQGRREARLPVARRRLVSLRRMVGDGHMGDRSWAVSPGFQAD